MAPQIDFVQTALTVAIGVAERHKKARRTDVQHTSAGQMNSVAAAAAVQKLPKGWVAIE